MAAPDPALAGWPPKIASHSTSRAEFPPHDSVAPLASGMRFLLPITAILLGLGWFLWWRVPAPPPTELAPPALGTTSEPGVADSQPLVTAPDLASVPGERTQVAENAPPPETAAHAASAPVPPPNTFAVRVLDAQGQPSVGQPVVLQRPRLFGDLQTLETEQTDASGRVHFPFQKSRDPGAPNLYGPGLIAAVDIPHEEPIQLEFPRPPEPGDEFTLTLPALGAVVVEVTGPDGQPFTQGPVKVWSRWIPAGEVGMQVYGGYERCHDAGRTTEQGETRYEPVGFGIVMTTSVQARGYLANSLSDFPGPQAPGDVVRVVIPLGKPVPFVTAQLFDMRGRPMAHYELKGRVYHRHQADDRARVSVFLRETTDAEGRFAFPFTGPLQVEGERYLVIEHGSAPTGRHADPEWSQARVSIPLQLRADEDYDLGAIHCQPPTLLVAGQVIDSLGQPQPGVRIDVGAPRKTSSGWPWRHYTRTETDTQGRYQLLDFDIPEQLRIQVVHPTLTSEVQVVTPRGQTGVDFVLQEEQPVEQPPVGSLKAAVVCDEGVHPAYFELEMRYADGHKERVPLMVLQAEPRTIPNRRAGAFSITITHRLQTEPMLTFEDLVIPVDGVLDDARLLPIDLRGHARVVTWTVHTPDGRPLRNESLKVRLPESRETLSATTDTEGRLSLPLPRLVQRVELSLVRDRWQGAQVGQTEPVRFTKP